jgi:NAD+ diphosphatase
MADTHCRECGTRLITKYLEHEGEVPYCPACGKFRFPLFNVVVSMIVVNEQNGRILLIKQYGKPDYMLVAGYVSKGENLKETIAREVKEETGLTAASITFNDTRYFAPTNALVCNFIVTVSDDSEFSPNYEIDSSSWFTPEQARENIIKGNPAEEFLELYLRKFRLDDHE